MHSAINNMEYVTVASSKFIPTTCPSTTHSRTTTTYTHTSVSFLYVCSYQFTSFPGLHAAVARKDAFTYCKRRKAGQGLMLSQALLVCQPNSAWRRRVLGIYDNRILSSDWATVSIAVGQQLCTQSTKSVPPCADVGWPARLEQPSSHCLPSTVVIHRRLLGADYLLCMYPCFF